MTAPTFAHGAAEIRRAGLTAKQYAMLVAANGVSLPGDGLRIKGSGKHATASALEKRGFVRVNHGSNYARVHITETGRKLHERLARACMPHSHAGGPDDQCCECIFRGLVDLEAKR